MKYGFIKVSTAVPEIRVADCEYNSTKIISCIEKAAKEKSKVVVFPELTVTGYTCGDLFFQDALLDASKKAISAICAQTEALDVLSIIGAPFLYEEKLYNCAFVLYRGSIIAIIPKTHLPNYDVFSEQRYFMPGVGAVREIFYDEEIVPFGTDIIIKDANLKNFALSVEICEDLWTVNSPSNRHALAGATVICNLSAGNEVAGKSKKREYLIKAQSDKLTTSYIYANAGMGESTSDMVFAGDSVICELGTVLKRSELFTNSMVFAEIDLDAIASERRMLTTFAPAGADDYYTVEINFDFEDTCLERKIDKTPFVPCESDREDYLEEVLKIQATGLAKRLLHTKANTAVIGVSGGLDSTLALLVTVRAFEMAGLDKKNIVAITMPCFGTTNRTRSNAELLAEELGATFREINIKNAVSGHFKDIGHNENVFDVTYENSQARERTQVLMDVANELGGLVIGTGDMSEMALGWATYNGDHMSMYGVNCGVTKTLLRHLVSYEAQKTENKAIKKILEDILDTPVSPELLPPKDGEIAQKTEQFVGPYILHDFFLYYMLRYGFTPSKIYYLAKHAFFDEYDNEEILKWMKVFYRRFFTQQFKRSCVPDGPKVAEVGLSPRGDLRMPSDACGTIWLSELETLEL